MREKEKPKPYKKPKIVYEKKIETLAAVCDTAWIGPGGTCCMGGLVANVLLRIFRYMLEEKYKSTLTALINEELNSGKVFCFVVSTLSMLPLIRPEDEIVVRKGTGQTLKCGDIVVFEKFRELYTHRLLCKRMSGPEMTLVTKGDNSFRADDPISEKDLLGKVTRIRKANRSINLEGRFWKIANTLAGTLSYLEWTVFGLLRGLKRSIPKFQ